MPLIGFSVFKEEVKSGKKRQTIRKLRHFKGKENPIKVHDPLFLYWHLRRPDCEKLGEARCTETFFIDFNYHSDFLGGGPKLRIDRFKDPSKRWSDTRQLLDSEMEDLAKRDGFNDALAMGAWFDQTHQELGKQIFQVIRW